MKRLITLTLIGLCLSGCIFRTHKADIIQGNIITDAQVRQLHAGMSEADVRNIMGNPVMDNVFTPNRMTYLYTFQEGYGSMQKKSVTLIMQNGRVVDIQTT